MCSQRAPRHREDIFAADDIELFKDVRTLCLQLFPRLMNFTPGNNDEPGMAVVSFAPEIETEVDAFYKRMYDQEIPIDRVITALRRAKESANAHDHEFLACFLHGLFDEHRFFSTYPPNELALTAYLFGDLIQHKVLDSVPLGIAVRYVLDALKNPPESNWFRFGAQALARFQPRLVEWPQLAHQILGIPHVAQNPAIANVAREAISRRPEAASDEGAVMSEILSREDDVAPPAPPRVVFRSIYVDDDDEDTSTPEGDAPDKVLFIVNNLAPTNLGEKASEMGERLRPEHFAWFAHYLVAQRVSIEPNNHALYLNLLETLDLSALMKRILHETYLKLAALLNAETTVQSSTERTLLKNLGAWLGAMTLAKNRPIKHRNIAFKDLLIEGFETNRLIVAIPFVCKVLEQSHKSLVFRPPNPWLMGIVRLLVELYQFAELKLNLKFEIEVLCKALGVDLKDIEPTTTLRNRPPKALIPAAAAATFGNVGGPQPLPSTPATQMQPPTRDERAEATASPAGMLQTMRMQPYAPAVSLQDAIAAALRNLLNFMTFSAPLFASNPSLRHLAHIAIDRAVREIIAPVVERSVTIAGISTRELTMKDFAMEGNEDKMRQAAHLMVQNLAGSLALVTCKEPLRIGMVTNMRNLLLQNGFSEQNMPEQALLVVAADNLDLACSIVEKVARERAVAEVDEGLANAYLARRTHRERSREAFWDTAAMAASHYSGMLPDPLRLKLGGLQPQQLKVYEDFGRIRALSAQFDGAADSAAAAAAAAAVGGVRDESPAPEAGGLSIAQAMEKFTAHLGELERRLATLPGNQSVQQLGIDHELVQLVDETARVVLACVSRDDAALSFSQKVVQLLYRSETKLAREIHVVLLERLCNYSVKAAREVSAWLVYAEDERKFNVAVTVTLVRASIVNLAKLDQQLATFVQREFRPTVVNFVAQFVAACVLANEPVASREQLAHCIDALVKATQAGHATDAYVDRLHFCAVSPS